MSKNEVRDVDHGFADMISRVKALRGSSFVKVGVLSDSDRGGLHQKLPDGKSAPLTVAEIAAVNEFGTKDGRIPSRPAFRGTFDRMREELSRDASRLILQVVIDGTMTADRALDLLGLKLATAIRKTITTGSEVQPSNADSTKRRKEAKGRGSKAVRTLFDTGRLVGAIAWARVTGESQEKPQYVSGGR